MLNCTFLTDFVKNPYALEACSTANTATTQAFQLAATGASHLNTHMVSQFERFDKFTSSEPSIERTAELSQRLFTGLAANSMFHITSNFTLKSASSLFNGKILNSLFYGLIAAGGAAMTCGFISLTLDPVGAVEFFNQQ